MTTHQYIIAWAAYLLGTLGCLAVWWRITRALGAGYLRRYLRLGATFAMLTPAISNPGMSYLAPALLICLFDGLSHSPDTMLRTVPLILASQVTAITFTLIVGLASKKSGKTTPDAEPSSVKNVRIEPSL